MPRHQVFPRVLALLLATASGLLPLSADLIKLKQGGVIDGKIVKEDGETLKVEVLRGATTVRKADIAEIVRQKSSVEVLEEKLLALTPASPGRYFETGQWCVETLDLADLGIRLIRLAMQLDAGLYVQGQHYLGDYYLAHEDVARAARCYLAALRAAPANPACRQRYARVQGDVQFRRREANESLADGLDALGKGKFADAARLLAKAESSPHREYCEQLLGLPLSALVTYSQASVACRTCKGAREVDCPNCNGKGAFPCVVCNGAGTRAWQSVAGTELRNCDSCRGWGNSLCAVCKAVRFSRRPRALPGGAVEAPAGERSRSDAPPDPGGDPSPGAELILLDPGMLADAALRASAVLRGGSLPCPACKNLALKLPGPLTPDRLADCRERMRGRLRGTMTWAEQARTRMANLGEVPGVEGGPELARTPVWWAGKWVTADQRAQADPAFVAPPPAAAPQSREALRQCARPLVIAGSPEDVESQLAGLLSAEEGEPAVDSALRVVDFVARATDAAEPVSGPFVELDPTTRRLRPVLLRQVRPYRIRAALLDTENGPGVPVAPEAQPATWLGRPGTVVRIYFLVTGAQREIGPVGDRDQTTLHLLVRPKLVDFLDPTGKILATSE